MSMFVTNVAFNTVTLGIQLALSFWAIWLLIRFRRDHFVQILQPFYLSGAIFFINLASAIFTYGTIFLISWRSFIFYFIGALSIVMGFITVMILKYYQCFVQAENKIRLAAKLMSKEQQFLDVGSLKDPSKLDKALENQAMVFFLGFIGFLEYAGPYYLFVIFSFPDFWPMPMSTIDPRVLTFNLVVGGFSVMMFSAGLVWIGLEIRKKQKDFTERIIDIAGGFALMMTWIVFVFIIIYASPLLRISFEGFQFMPFPIYHVSIGAYAISIIRKVYRWKAISQKNASEKSSREKRDPSRSARSTNVSDAGAAVSPPLVSVPSAVLNPTNAAMKEEMLALLNSLDGFKLMLDAAKNEFCVENVLFCVAISDWESMPSGSEKRLATAREIYNVFVVETAAACVNISYTSRLEIHQAFRTGEIPDTLFANAKKEVLKLLLWQTYMKLRDTDDVARILKSPKSSA